MRIRKPQADRGLKVLGTSIILTSMLGLAACTGSETTSADGATKNWDYFIIVPLSHPVGQEAQRFAEAAEEATNGELEITVRPVGELPISSAQSLGALRNGDLDLVSGYVGNLGADLPFAGVLNLPLVATSIEEGDAAIEAMMPQIEESFDEYNGELLWTFHWGMQVLHGSGDPLVAPSGLAGRKVRTNGPQQAEFFEDWGAFPSTLPNDEVASSLNTGVVDALVTAPLNIVGSGFTDFIDWTYTAGLNPGISFIVVNQDAMAELSEDSQEALRELSSEFGQSVTDSLATQNDGALEEMKSAGVTVNSPSEAQVDEMRDSVRDYWSRWAEENNATEELDAAITALDIK